MESNYKIKDDLLEVLKNNDALDKFKNNLIEAKAQEKDFDGDNIVGQMASFIWKQSPEGFDYWYKIYKMLLNWN